MVWNQDSKSWLLIHIDHHLVDYIKDSRNCYDKWLLLLIRSLNNYIDISRILLSIIPMPSRTVCHRNCLLLVGSTWDVPHLCTMLGDSYAVCEYRLLWMHGNLKIMCLTNEQSYTWLVTRCAQQKLNSHHHINNLHDVAHTINDKQRCIW